MLIGARVLLPSTTVTSHTRRCRHARRQCGPDAGGSSRVGPSAARRDQGAGGQFDVSHPLLRLSSSICIEPQNDSVGSKQPPIVPMEPSIWRCLRFWVNDHDVNRDYSGADIRLPGLVWPSDPYRHGSLERPKVDRASTASPQVAPAKRVFSLRESRRHKWPRGGFSLRQPGGGPAR